MYGMVNKAVEEMVLLHFGSDTWEEIKRAAGLDLEMFISNNGYADEVTYQLVGAASKILNLPTEQILHAFGEHWVLKTAEEGYGYLMAAGGSSLGEFLNNLPNFHARVSLIFPNLQPPIFRVSDVTTESLHLHYFSHRPGLQPFVEGLLSGLAKRFQTHARISVLQNREQGADHGVFLVEWPQS